MRRGACLVLAALLLAGPGCAGLRADRQAGRWLEEGGAAYRARDCDAAWPVLRRIGETYPDSAASSDAFLMAAGCFGIAYQRHRFAQPDSHWLTEEPEFMFGWIAHFFGSEFPRRHVQALLRGMNYSFGQQFVAWCKARPDLAMWVIEIDEDNGVIRQARGWRQGGTPIPRSDSG